VAHAVLDGQTGPVRDAVLLNAAAALVALDAVGGDGPDSGTLVTRLGAAVTRAATSIDSGAARAAMLRWIATSQALAER
jgi:anthranilate phosphoribosyltransferase